MKQSIYNHHITQDGTSILYNCRTDEILFINNELDKLLKKHSDHIDDLQKVHPDFYSYLKGHSFLVHEDEDEVKKLIDEWAMSDKSGSTFTLIVNPTQDCNMHCWYCYEKKHKGSIMGEETYRSLVKAIERIVSSPELKYFQLMFFGGEPLLAYNKIVRNLMEEADKLCEMHHTILTVNFTSNSSLLREEMIQFFSAYHKKHPISWQITLDGNEQFHDKTRFTCEGLGSYWAIIYNINSLTENGMKVVLRCNYTEKNIISFYDVLDDLQKHINTQNAHLLHVVLQQVWQDKTDLTSEVELLTKAMQEKGYITNNNHSSKKERCYADKENSIVVNYDGNLYKCTARDFEPELTEGHLGENGNFIYTDLYHHRMSCKFKNKTCLACKILPLCGGGCTQSLIGKEVTDRCIKGYDNKRKNLIINEQVKEIINKKFKKNKILNENQTLHEFESFIPALSEDKEGKLLGGFYGVSTFGITPSDVDATGMARGVNLNFFCEGACNGSSTTTTTKAPSTTTTTTTLPPPIPPVSNFICF